MKHSITTPRCISFLIVLAACNGALRANDVTAVNWGGNYVSSTVTFPDLTGFSNTTPIISPSGSYAGTSATLYGGASSINTTYNYFTTPDTGITDNGSADEITFSWPGNSSASAFGEVLWQQADFLNGAASSTIVFDSLSSLFVSLSGNPETTRFIVDDGGTYYLSNLNFTTTTTLTNPDSNTTWATYVPSASPSATPFNAGTATFAQHTFSNVQAVGYYFDAENQSGQTYTYGVSGYTAQVASVPEPSAFTLLGVFGLLCAARICNGKKEQ